MKLTSSCNGVLDNNRIRSVSVVIFNGIKFKMTIFNGRMSCVVARELSITKIFSFFSSSMAGNLSGNLKGIFSQINRYHTT